MPPVRAASHPASAWVLLKIPVNSISTSTHGFSVGMRIGRVTQFWHTVFMQPVSLSLIAAGLFLAIGAVLTIVGLFRAPDGYEDSNGFHFASHPEGNATSPVTHPIHPNLA